MRGIDLFHDINVIEIAEMCGELRAEPVALTDEQGQIVDLVYPGESAMDAIRRVRRELDRRYGAVR